MAKRKGQVVAATLVTPDTTCKFPIVDINDVGGGRLIVDTIAERNAIPPKFLKAGMIVYVGGTVKKDYKLKAGYGNPLTDANWEEYAPGVPAGVLTSHQKLEDIQYNTPVPSYNGTSTLTTLSQKLAEIDSRLNNALTSHQKVEDIVYNNPTASGFNTLVQKLADLETKSTTAPGIEDITWNTTPTDHAHQSYLKDEIEYFYTTLADMNDPTKIMVTNLSSSTTTDLQSKLNAIDTRTYTTAEIVDNTSGSPVLLSVLLARLSKSDGIRYDGMSTDTVKDKLDNLQTQLNNINLHVESITWSTTPSGTGRNSSLATELNNLFTKIADMNKADKIDVPNSATDTSNSGKLDDVVKDIYTQVDEAAKEVQYLLFNTAYPNIGSLTSQEFLTTWAGKILSIAVYTNSDATLVAASGGSHAVSVILEQCGPTATTYTTISGTAVDLDASDTGLLKEITFGTPIAITANTRIRLNITAYDFGNTIESLSVRVKLRQD